MGMGLVTGLRFFWRRADPFLRDIKGVIHVGANRGQEAGIYARHNLNVLWIEPVPDIYRALSKRIARYPQQKAICQLITDGDDQDYKFHVSNFGGCSSSIHELAGHKKIWPYISYRSTIDIKSMRLPTAIKKWNADPGLYDALVLDTQGSELLVLKGAEEMLPRFRYVKTEAADFEAYAQGCQLRELDVFMQAQGFIKIAQKPFLGMRAGRCYYDVVYQLK